MKKKLVSSVLSVTLALSGSASVLAAQPKVSLSQEGTKFNFFQKDESRIYKIDTKEDTLAARSMLAIPAIEKHMVIKDNKLIFNAEAAAKEFVSADVIAVVEAGVAATNASLANGALTINNGQLAVGNSKKVSPYAYMNNYWWGYAITYNNEETIQQAYSMSQVGNWSGYVSVWAGLTGAAPVSLVTALFAWRTNSLSYEMTFKNRGKGVTLNFHTVLTVTPYTEVTTNR